MQMRCPLSPLLFIILLRVLGRAIKEKCTKDTKVGKENLKLYLLVNNVILHLKDPQTYWETFRSCKYPQEGIGYKMSVQNP